MKTKKAARYETVWRNKFLGTEARTIGEMAGALQQAAELLREMEKAGVTLVDDGGTADDHATLATTDADVAKRFGLDRV